MEEFLNPKSMLTPGIAGGIAMAITNALAMNFGCDPGITSLTLSFLVGLLVFVGSKRVALPTRLLLYALNSLIIFSVAAGTNQAAVGAASKRDESPVVGTGLSPHAAFLASSKLDGAPFFANWFDGTVKARTELASEIDELSDEQSLKALDELRTRPDMAGAVPVVPAAESRALLKRIAESPRTAGDAALIHAAVKPALAGVRPVRPTP